MNKQPVKSPSQARKNHHLQINDLAYLLEMDQGNLSRFEAQKILSSKASLGYHILLNLSIENTIRQVFEGGFQTLLDRCFLLYEKILNGPKNGKNVLRLDGLDKVINRLMQFQQSHA